MSWRVCRLNQSWHVWSKHLRALAGGRLTGRRRGAAGSPGYTLPTSTAFRVSSPSGGCHRSTKPSRGCCFMSTWFRVREDSACVLLVCRLRAAYELLAWCFMALACASLCLFTGGLAAHARSPSLGADFCFKTDVMAHWAKMWAVARARCCPEVAGRWLRKQHHSTLRALGQRLGLNLEAAAWLELMYRTTAARWTWCCSTQDELSGVRHMPGQIAQRRGHPRPADDHGWQIRTAVCR